MSPHKPAQNRAAADVTSHPQRLSSGGTAPPPVGGRVGVTGAVGVGPTSVAVSVTSLVLVAVGDGKGVTRTGVHVAGVADGTTVVGVKVTTGVGVRDGVGLTCSMGTRGVGVRETVAVLVGVGVAVHVALAVAVAVRVGLIVLVGVAVGRGDAVGVAEGRGRVAVGLGIGTCQFRSSTFMVKGEPQPRQCPCRYSVYHSGFWTPW